MTTRPPSPPTLFFAPASVSGLPDCRRPWKGPECRAEGPECRAEGKVGLPGTRGNDRIQKLASGKDSSTDLILFIGRDWGECFGGTGEG